MNVQLRKVSQEDWDYILRLRNSNYIRPFMYTKHRISKPEHYRYLKKQNKNSNFKNWIISMDSENVGYVRVLDNDVSIMIEKKYHGKNIGTHALKILEKEARKFGIRKLVGRVMIDNKKSKQIFLNNNYKLMMYWFEKKI